MLDTQGKDLFERFLTYEASDRISAKAALQHAYFKDLDPAWKAAFTPYSFPGEGALTGNAAAARTEAMLLCSREEDNFKAPPTGVPGTCKTDKKQPKKRRHT
jgi:hypothetical protein